MSRSEFEAFYASAKTPCLRALLATVADPYEADDLVAEAFTRAWRDWSKVSRHPAPEAWVVRTALNLHRDRHRHDQHPKAVLAAQPDAVTDAPYGLDPSLLAALRALPEQQRLVVALRVLLDLDTETTATELDISAGTVTTHLKRGLASLRTRLADYAAPGGHS